MNALCNLLRKKLQEVAASLPGRFLSRRCFMLCITVEAEPRIAKQYKCHHCCSCKNYRGKGMEGGEKSVFVSFSLADQKIANSFWGILLGDSGRVVNSLDFCPASLKSLGCFYFRCVLSSQWKAVTVNFRILHSQL